MLYFKWYAFDSKPFDPIKVLIFFQTPNFSELFFISAAFSYLCVNLFRHESSHRRIWKNGARDRENTPRTRPRNRIAHRRGERFGAYARASGRGGCRAGVHHAGDGLCEHPRLHSRPHARRERHDGVDGASGRAGEAVPRASLGAFLCLEFQPGRQSAVPPEPAAGRHDRPRVGLRRPHRGGAPHPEEGCAQRHGHHARRGDHRRARRQERLGARTDTGGRASTSSEASTSTPRRTGCSGRRPRG